MGTVDNHRHHHQAYGRQQRQQYGQPQQYEQQHQQYGQQQQQYGKLYGQQPPQPYVHHLNLYHQHHHVE